MPQHDKAAEDFILRGNWLRLTQRFVDSVSAVAREIRERLEEKEASGLDVPGVGVLVLYRPVLGSQRHWLAWKDDSRMGALDWGHMSVDHADETARMEKLAERHPGATRIRHAGQHEFLKFAENLKAILKAAADLKSV